MLIFCAPSALVAIARGGSVSLDIKVRSPMARSGLEVQQAAVKALFLREIKTRSGKYKLGYLWAILEPAAHLLILLTMFGFIMHRTLPDISYPVFLLNGLIPYFLLKNIAMRSIGAIEANSGLFNYRPIKPFDTIVARAQLEILIHGIVYVILMIFVGIAGEEFEVTNIITLVISWLLLAILGCGVGLIFMVIGKLLPDTVKFLPILIRPLYFLSCIMYPLHSIPKDYWPYLLWNPIIHAVEISRESVVPGYISEGTSITYLATSSLLIFFIGISLYRVCEERMLTS